MAYVLGFFAADGYMWVTRRGSKFLGFQINDRELLVEIRKTLDSSHKIAIRVRNNPKHNDSFRLQIGSKEMFNDLLKLRMTPAKSKTLEFPNIPKRYLAYFVRGYFEGDGNVYFKEHFAKDRNKKRWHFTSRFTSGSESFLKTLHTKLRENVLSGGYLYKKIRGYELVFSRHDSIALYKFMYNNTATKLFLPRKKKIFEKAIKTLYGDVAQLG